MNTHSESSSPTLLHLDASPRGERSHSRRLGRRFLDAWRATHPSARVLTRDIGHEPPPFVTEAWVEGAFAPPDAQSAAAKDAIAVSDQYIDEVLAADEIVITTPIYNLSLPAALKAWIDQVVRAGRTFAVKNGGFEGMLRGKRVIVIVASGGDFRPQSAGGAYNFIEPYLRAVLGFIGITQVEFVYAHSLSAAEPVVTEVVETARTTLEQLAHRAA